jgi:alkylhydroperoxidase family enzyme
LRTAHLAGCGYIRGQHEPLARDIGLTDREIVALNGRSALGLAEADRQIVAVVDELHATGTLSDPAWACLAHRLDEAQLIELLMLVGHYRMLAGTLRTLRVRPDEPGR